MNRCVAVSARARRESSASRVARDDNRDRVARARARASATRPRARVAPLIDAMGFLTRFIASGIDDGVERQRALEKHLEKTSAKCATLCVRERREARGKRDASTR